MATTVAQHPVTAFTSPTNGTSPIDADEVVANDSAIRAAYNAHDADTGIHVQSSVFGSRPAAGTSGRKYITVDQLSAPTQIRSFYDDGTNWYEHNYFGSATTIAAALTVSSGGIAVTGNSTITGTLGGITTLTATTVAGTLSTAAQPNVTSVGTLSSLTVGGAITVTSGGVAVTGNSTITGTLGGITTLTATTVAGTLSTAAQPNVTSVGTLSSLTVSGDVTVDTSTFKVDSANNNVYVGTTAAYRGGRLVVKGENKTQTSTTANLHVSTTDTQDIDVGGSIGLGGQVGGDETPFAYLSGRKETATAGNYAGYLAFATQESGATIVERMRISSTGNVGIGTASPSTPLHVVGASTLAGVVSVAAGSTTNALTVTTTGAIQQSIRYDGSNRLDVSVGATGAVTFDAVGTDASVSFADEVAVGGATVSSTTALMTPAATTGVSSLRIPHGTSPAVPVNGDVWTDTLGMYVRINGVTKTIAFV